MENKEVIKKYSIKKRTALVMMLHVVILMFAFAISIYGIARTSLENFNLNRIIIYGGQAIVCLILIIFGIVYFNKKDTKYFKSVTIAYAIVEAVRVSLLQTVGVDEMYGIVAKLILVFLAIDSAFLSENIDNRKGLTISILMVLLEVLLYIDFIVGFPAIKTRLLYLALPLIGIFVSSSTSLFVYARLEQIKYSNEKNKLFKKK